jgi:SHOCT-like domain
MTTVEERMKILTMIQDGTITAEEGMRLLETIEEPQKRTAAHTRPAASGSSRFVRVQVTDTDSGKTRVNVRLPISVVSAGLKMGARFSPEVEGLDMSELMGYIRTGETGKVIDIFDDEDGERVEVYVE